MSEYRNNQLSENFTREEVACKGTDCCGGAAPIDNRLVNFLQHLRETIEAPVYINSGFRCIKHNSEIGGADGSYHTLGCAADVRADMPFNQLYDAAQDVALMLGYGHLIPYYKDGFLHIDIRDLL